jgi:hypothetical protein
MALTQGNVTIKLSGGDYNSWAGFWNDLGDLTGNITCTVDASDFTNQDVPATVTENLNGYTITVQPVSYPTTTDGTTGARFTFVAGGMALRVSVAGAGSTIIQGIVLKRTTQDYVCFLEQATASFIFRRNIVSGGYDGICKASSASCWVYNNIFINCFYSILDFNGGIVCQNNTGVNSPDVCFIANNTAGLYENNVAYNNTSTDFYTRNNATGRNNASEDGSAADANWAIGVNNIATLSVSPFVDVATLDLNPDTDGVLIGAGKDLSVSFTDDFFGVTRVSWDIGACEYINPFEGYIFIKKDGRWQSVIPSGSLDNTWLEMRAVYISLNGVWNRVV